MFSFEAFICDSRPAGLLQMLLTIIIIGELINWSIYDI